MKFQLYSDDTGKVILEMINDSRVSHKFDVMRSNDANNAQLSRIVHDGDFASLTTL